MEEIAEYLCGELDDQTMFRDRGIVLFLKLHNNDNKINFITPSGGVIIICFFKCISFEGGGKRNPNIHIILIGLHTLINPRISCQHVFLHLYAIFPKEKTNYYFNCLVFFYSLSS